MQHSILHLYLAVKEVTNRSIGCKQNLHSKGRFLRPNTHHDPSGSYESYDTEKMNYAGSVNTVPCPEENRF